MRRCTSSSDVALWDPSFHFHRSPCRLLRGLCSLSHHHEVHLHTLSLKFKAANIVMAIPFIALIPGLASYLPYLLTVTVIYILFVAVYRLHFSPIAQIPGPRIAALTSLYEFYHDCIHLGQFYYQIQKLHEQYGMVIARRLLRDDCPLISVRLTRSQAPSSASALTKSTLRIRTSLTESTM